MNKNAVIGILILALLGSAVAYFMFPKCPDCPQCPECPPVAEGKVKENRQALLSLAEIALNRKAKSLSEIESLVKYDREFYLAFFNRYEIKSELGNQYYYARHGSCCPCADGGRGCCACVGGSAFGAPLDSFTLAMNSEVNNPLYTLASYSAQKQSAERKPLKLDKKIIDTTDIFFVPPNTPPGPYFVTFKGKINLVLDIDVKEEGAFDVVAFR